MFKWLKSWLNRQQEREHGRLLQESRRLRAELEKKGIDITLTPEQKARLRDKARGIDPEILKRISQFDLDDDEPKSRTETG